MATPHPQPVTEDALVQYRLKELEEFAVGAREMERRIDTLVLSVGAMEKSVAEIHTEMRTNAEQASKTLARLHERLDQTLREKAREEGREEGRAQAKVEAKAEAIEQGRQVGLSEARRSTWAVSMWAVGTTVVACGVVVALLNLLLN